MEEKFTNVCCIKIKKCFAIKKELDYPKAGC